MRNENVIIPDDYIEISEITEIQKSLLFLMKKIHEICEENGLTYNIFGGTMLGAVRHGGLIPWDDDIDITMPRHDYMKFMEIVKEKYSDEYCVYNFPDKNYVYPFAKFAHKDTLLIENLKSKYNKIKLYIDVFPVDGYPKKNEKTFFKKLTKLKHNRCCVVCFTERRKGLIEFFKYIIRKTEELIVSVPGMQFYLKKEINAVLENKYEDAEYILCQGAGWNEKGKLKKEIYLDRTLYDLGNIKVWGIRNYHDHLTNLYGDYIELPPIEKRISDHNYKLYIQKRLLEKINKGD